MNNSANISFLLYILFVGTSRADLIYNEPYLGEHPYSIESWDQSPSNLSSLVKKSEVIIIGVSGPLKEERQNDHIVSYEADVRIGKLLKGILKETVLRLRWFEPSITGISEGSQHVFFMKRSGGSWEVLRKLYVSTNGSKRMRAIGAYDCSADVGLDVLTQLITGRAPPKLGIRLKKEYDSGDRYSAVMMAAAVKPPLGEPVLKQEVIAAKYFDRNLYETATYVLAKRYKNALESILRHIPSSQSEPRMGERVAFDVAATFGDDKIIPVIRQLIAERPELAVSAAFALAGIGGPKAQEVIESWTRDSTLATRKEVVERSAGMRTERPFAEFFKDALARMK